VEQGFSLLKEVKVNFFSVLERADTFTFNQTL
jgi:hypothetical protein